MASSRMLSTRSAVQCREAALEPEPAVEQEKQQIISSLNYPHGKSKNSCIPKEKAI